MAICPGPECSKEVVLKNLCRGHYQQMMKGRELTPLFHKPPKGKCIGPECERDADYKESNLCSAHYQQQNRYGYLKPINAPRVTGKKMGQCPTDGCIYYGRLVKGLCPYKCYRKQRYYEDDEFRAKRTLHSLLRNRATVVVEAYVNVEWLRNRDGDNCHYCETELRFDNRKDFPNSAHLEHVIPVSKGGVHSESNCVLACRKCNLHKLAKDVKEFLATPILLTA